MKKIFTIASAALLAASATAAPKAESLKAEMTVEAQQQFATNIARIQNGEIESIDGEIIGKRSCQIGNIIYDAYAIKTGKVCDFISFRDSNGELVQKTWDEMPLYAVEYCISGTNATTGKDSGTTVALMLFWPSEYYRQMFTWDGSWDEITYPSGYVEYVVPVEDRNYDIVPFEDVVGQNSEMAAPFYYTGFVDPFAYLAENEKNYTGIENYQCMPYGGLTYQGSDISIDSDYDINTMSGNRVTQVTFQEYDPEDEYMLIDNKFYFVYDSNNTNGQFLMTYDGEGFTKGFTTKVYDINLPAFHIFNAGLLDEDNNKFYEYTDNEEPLQQYYIKFGNDQLVGIGLGQAEDNPAVMQDIEEDPSFENVILDKDYYKYLVGEGFEEAKSFYGYSYLFSAAEQAPTNCQWNIKYATSHTYGSGMTVDDYLVPTPGMFVSYMEYANADKNVRSAWAKSYGFVLIQCGKYLLEPASEGAYIANNTVNGLEIRYNDNVGNVVNMHAEEYVYHPNANDVRIEETVSALGTFEPDRSSVAELFGTKGGVKVGARNGMISIDSMEAGNVAVYTMDGALVNAARVNGNSTVNIPAAKGMYIVKVGNETRKVVL